MSAAFPKKSKSSDRILQVSPNIDLTKIKSNVKVLRAHKDVHISDVKGEVLESYKYIADNLSLLYGTKHYRSFIDSIHSTISETDTFKPGTVGAWLYGCSLEHNLDIEPGCTPVCAGSIPNYVESENDRSWGFSNNSMNSGSSSKGKQVCDRLVMEAVWNPKENGFNFTDLNDSTHRKNTYIYTAYDAKSFPGLSQAEKTGLEQYGVHKVMVYTYDNTCKKYTEITKDFTKVSDIPDRTQSHPKPPATSSSSSSSSAAGGSDPSSTTSYAWLWILIIIVIVLILIAIIYRNNRY